MEFIALQYFQFFERSVVVVVEAKYTQLRLYYLYPVHLIYFVVVVELRVLFGSIRIELKLIKKSSQKKN